MFSDGIAVFMEKLIIWKKGKFLGKYTALNADSVTDYVTLIQG
jgi:hypothetical protein